MNTILFPDKNNFYLKLYHSSNKGIIPLISLSLFSNNFNKNEYINYFVNGANIMNLTYHSYVSSSCIITDYIKPKMISKIFRCTNLTLHGTCVIGYILFYHNKLNNTYIL